MIPNIPQSISREEWDEIVDLRYVRESWGFDESETGASFRLRAYGAKFGFVGGSPGSVGDLYVIHGDCLGGPPVVLHRGYDKKLQIVSYDEPHPIEPD